jgi:hypothetical protein
MLYPLSYERLRAASVGETLAPFRGPGKRALTFELSGIILAANTNFVLRGEPGALDMPRKLVRRRLGITPTPCI